jgi:hypothetical protein
LLLHDDPFDRPIPPALAWHTPATQYPLAQSLAAEHAAPVGRPVPVAVA